MKNRQIVLAQRPTGAVDASTTSLVESPRPECGPDQALIKVGMLSIDPTIRTWMNDAPGYLPPIAIGDVIRAGGAGVVVESRSPRYSTGDVVVGMTNWQEWAIADEANRFMVLDPGLGVDLATSMNVLFLQLVRVRIARRTAHRFTLPQLSVVRRRPVPLVWHLNSQLAIQLATDN